MDHYLLLIFICYGVLQIVQFLFRRSIVRCPGGKPPKSARPDSNASPQPKTHGSKPAPTQDAEKEGRSTAKRPKPEEEGTATATAHHTATNRATTTGKAYDFPPPHFPSVFQKTENQRDKCDTIHHPENS